MISENQNKRHIEHIFKGILALRRGARFSYVARVLLPWKQDIV